jgi:acyl-homoserine lactone acylase PvdQ
VSFYWTGPYRHERIAALLRGIAAPTPEDIRLLQMDTHSSAAERMLPRVLAWDYTAAGAREAAELLRAWDRRVEADSCGAAVFEAFLVCLERGLTQPVLGADAVLYFKARVFGVADVALERPHSRWWRGEEPRVVVERALAAAVGLLEERLGRRRAGWRWGRLHRYLFLHPGARGSVARLLLNPRPRPARGDSNTVNVSWYSLGRGTFDATTVPSQRMVVPLGDIDGMRVIMPLGQSGQPGHRHYDDMTDRWVRGDLVPLPLSRGAVEKIAKDRLVLEP